MLFASACILQTITACCLQLAASLVYIYTVRYFPLTHTLTCITHTHTVTQGGRGAGV